MAGTPARVNSAATNISQASPTPRTAQEINVGLHSLFNAKTGDREQFKALFRAASRREFELVLFWSLDRFSREGVLETLTYLQNLTQYGVGYRSFTEQYLDSCGMFREAVISILAVIAKQERVRLSERTIAGLQRARAHGRIGGRPRAVCEPSEVVRLKTEGKPLVEIARMLRVSKSTVYRILQQGGK
jgi:DNA invertase Pin-like site-specific DNA recombinase